MDADAVIKGWPDESREAAQLVVDAYGDPHVVTESLLIWNRVGPWKRMVASRTFYRHDFPAPHTDSVESIIDYRVPPEKVGDLAAFDGSVPWTCPPAVDRRDSLATARSSGHVILLVFPFFASAHDNATGAAYPRGANPRDTRIRRAPAPARDTRSR
jgi:hypothetical protein